MSPQLSVAHLRPWIDFIQNNLPLRWIFVAKNIMQVVKRSKGKQKAANYLAIKKSPLVGTAPSRSSCLASVPATVFF